jgi:hypothetical protein
MENGRCISFYLPKPLVEDIEAGAGKLGISRSNQIHRLVEKAIRFRKK